jgi:hypothetical protein
MKMDKGLLHTMRILFASIALVGLFLTGVHAVETTAPPNDVAIWIFGEDFVYYSTERVNADETFEHEIRDDITSKMPSGQYSVVVQHPMYNDHFDVYPDSATNPQYVLGEFPTRGTELFKLAGAGSLQGSDAAEALMNALHSAMIDDTYTKFQFLVEKARVNINPIGEQIFDSTFEITGTTNLHYDGNELLVEVSTGFTHCWS